MPLNPIAGRVLPDLLAHQVQRRPEQEFLIFIDRTGTCAGRYTYAQVDALSNKIAAHLQSIGIGKGDGVCVHLPNVPEFLPCWFGIAKLGAYMVATNLRSAPDEMEYFLTHSESKALISHTAECEAWEPILEQCEAIDPKQVVMFGDAAKIGGHVDGGEILESGSEDFKAPALDPMDLAAVLYTSGTTSRPKGVMITQGNYVWAAEVQVRTQMLTHDDRYLVCLPYFHINAQTYSTLPVMSVGGSMVLMERFSKSRFWDIVHEHKPTVWSYVPALTNMLELHEPSERETNHGFRLWGGGLVHARLEKRFGVKTIGWFGMTETITVPVATSPLDEGKPGAVGWPNVGYRVRIMKEDGVTECAPGEVGELEIHGIPGVSLTKGYLKNPEATAETISEDGWLKTGDNVVADERGYITYVNRKKDMLKVGGENVAASEIERAAMGHPAVYEVAAIGIRDKILGEVPKLYVVLRPGESAEPQAIIDHCAGKLADFKVPRAVEFIDELPKGTLEKVSKKTLKEWEKEKRG